MELSSLQQKKLLSYIQIALVFGVPFYSEHMLFNKIVVASRLISHFVYLINLTAILTT